MHHEIILLKSDSITKEFMEIGWMRMSDASWREKETVKLWEQLARYLWLNDYNLCLDNAQEVEMSHLFSRKLSHKYVKKHLYVSLKFWWWISLQTLTVDYHILLINLI